MAGDLELGLGDKDRYSVLGLAIREEEYYFAHRILD